MVFYPSQQEILASQRVGMRASRAYPCGYEFVFCSQVSVACVWINLGLQLQQSGASVCRHLGAIMPFVLVGSGVSKKGMTDPIKQRLYFSEQPAREPLTFRRLARLSGPHLRNCRARVWRVGTSNYSRVLPSYRLHLKVMHHDYYNYFQCCNYSAQFTASLSSCCSKTLIVYACFLNSD